MESLYYYTNEEYKLLIDSVVDYAIYMLDLNGIITTWNPGAERVKGYQANEVIGKNFSMFYTDEDRSLNIPKTVLKTALVNNRFEGQGWRVKKDGTRFWATIIIYPIVDPETENPIGFAKITRDITELHITQKRNIELLVQSRKLESIGQIVGGIAHEFNNIFMAIVGGIETVISRIPEDPRITPLLQSAITSGQRGTALIKRMMIFSRKYPLTLISINITNFLFEMKDKFLSNVKKTVSVEIRVVLPDAIINSDKMQFETAILNLVMNANDAIPKNGKIIIATRQETITRNNITTSYACISVTDDGIGIDESILSQIIDPFFTTKDFNNTNPGLGLSVVHGLAAQQGGWLDIKSELDVGTTCELWLPIIN